MSDSNTKKMENQKKHILQGITMTHFYKGGFCIIAGVTLFLGGNKLLSVPVILFGILLLLSITGTQFDFKKQRFRIYLFLGIKIGVWSEFEEFEKLILESTNRKLPLANYKNSDGTRLISCAICFERKDGFREEVKEFVDYQKALKLYKLLLEKTELKGIDEIERLMLRKKYSIK